MLVAVFFEADVNRTVGPVKTKRGSGFIIDHIFTWLYKVQSVVTK